MIVQEMGNIVILYWCESFQYHYIKPEAKEQVDYRSLSGSLSHLLFFF